MATPPESPIEDVVYELEQTRVRKPAPTSLAELCQSTKFSKQEIRVMYRGFKTECPDGVVHEDCFKEIYAKLFPHGNSSLYAHHVFRAFDVNSTGALTFRDLLTAICPLLRGTAYDKVKFTFRLYDLNGDGRITRSEMGEIIHSVHELMGRRPHQPEEDQKAKDQLDRVFSRLDPNNIGYVTYLEWMKYLSTDESLWSALQLFTTNPDEPEDTTKNTNPDVSNS